MTKGRPLVLRKLHTQAFVAYKQVQDEVSATYIARQLLNIAQAQTGQAGSAIQTHSASNLKHSDDPSAAAAPVVNINRRRGAPPHHQRQEAAKDKLPQEHPAEGVFAAQCVKRMLWALPSTS